MQATEGALIAIVFGILVAHLGLLRFLHRCKDLMPVAMDGVFSDGLHPITEQLEGLGHAHLSVNDQLAEVCRIGADLADALEAMPAGTSSPTPSMSDGMPSIQTTIMELMLNRFLSPNHGGTTQQERAIQQDLTASPNDQPEDDSNQASA